jgi:pimeloyl-ACP methyl ester carboxylesterase
MVSAYDTTAEDGYLYAAPALRRGYAVLAFDGPGHGGSLYEQGLLLRPDFEKVLKPVVDFVLEQPDVDATRLVLVGRSSASNLAARGASAEHRIAGLISDPGQPDLGGERRAPLQAEIQEDRAAQAVAETEDRQLRTNLRHEPEKRFEVVPELLPRLDVTAPARGPTMAPQVEGVDLEVPAERPVDERFVAPGVLAEAVDDGQECARRPLGPPGLPEEPDAASRGDRSFLVALVHPASRQASAGSSS